MITVTGTNLGERQRQLNEKVNNAAKKCTKLDEFDFAMEEGDMDKFFMIDLAAKFKDIGYILETFKCGDNVHIIRALNKSTWLGEDQFINVINPEYLHQNIFPSMSIKMKKKLLCTLPSYLKQNEKMLIDFYKYCAANKFNNATSKFLVRTSESFKMTQLSGESFILKYLKDHGEETYMTNFFGTSFELLNCYIKANNGIPGYVFNMFRYLYSISNEKYLDMFESNNIHFGISVKLSKQIMKNHKNRVLNKPILYIKCLNREILIKYSTVDDVKFYAVALLPKMAQNFFYEYSYLNYGSILNLIPTGEKYSFIKKIFIEKYGPESFEVDPKFYQYKLYEMMTDEQKEVWALDRIDAGDETLGPGKEYLWYQFVNFKKSFHEIRQIINITTDQDKRLELLKVLVLSAKTQSDINTLLSYYSKRHMNEMLHNKELFVTDVIRKHVVYKFNKDCWTELEKIFYSLNVFNKEQFNKANTNHRHVALIYYVVNNEPVPEVIDNFIGAGYISTHTLLYNLSNVEKEKKQLVYEYVLQNYVKKVEVLSEQPYDDETKKSIKHYIDLVLKCIREFEKTKQDIPDIILKYIQIEWETYKKDRLFYEKTKELSRDDVKRFIKQDASLLIKNFPEIKKRVLAYDNFNGLLRKLKLYFSDDVAIEFSHLLKKCIKEDSYKLVKFAIYGIFVVSDENTKRELLEEYLPKSPQKDYTNNSINNLITIQESICREAGFSRPRIPMESYMPYLVGDYVQNCLPTLYSYLVNLPQPQCIQFVGTLVDKPVSIQKHGMRMAFHFFEMEELVKLVTQVWSKNRNVSIRMVVYQAVYDKVESTSATEERAMFELLKTLTASLKEDDSPEVFDVLYDPLSNKKHLIGEYLKAAWNCVQRFSDKSLNHQRMIIILSAMRNNLQHVSEDLVNCIVTEYIENMFKDATSNVNLKKSLQELYNEKRSLMIPFLAYVPQERQSERNWGTVKYILEKCAAMWDVVKNNKYVARKLANDLIQDIGNAAYKHGADNLSNAKVLIENILNYIKDNMPHINVHVLLINLRLEVITMKVIVDTAKESNTTPDTNCAIMKEMVTKLAIGFGQLINEYVESGEYYEPFLIKFFNIVSEKLFNIKLVAYDLGNKVESLGDLDASIIFFNALLNVRTHEAYKFISIFLPEKYSEETKVEYLNVIETLKAYEDKEIQYILQERFVNDFEYRLFIK